MKLLIIFISLSLSCLANPDLNIILPALKQVESLGDVNAIGDNGKAYGILQIHKVYVDEVNGRYGTNYTHSDMFDEVCSEEVFYLYMKFASKRFEKLYKRKPTEQDIVRMHNGGMYIGHRIKATIKYYNRYIKFKKKLNKIKSNDKKDNYWSNNYNCPFHRDYSQPSSNK